MRLLVEAGGLVYGAGFTTFVNRPFVPGYDGFDNYALLFRELLLF